MTALIPQIPAYLLDPATWGEPVRVWVPGAPVGKERPRFARVGRFVRTYTPAKTLTFERRVAEALWRFPAPPSPFRLVCLLVYGRPKKRPAWVSPRLWAEVYPLHVGNMDGDNGQKAVMDGAGDWLGNDRQVVSGTWWKVCGAEPGVLIEVSGLSQGWR